MAQGGSNKKVANGLVAASAAAVMAVYAAGYTRTRSAADQMEAQSDQRRPASPEGRGPGRAAGAVAASEDASGNPSQPIASASAASAGQAEARETPGQPAQMASLNHGPATVPPPSASPANHAPEANTAAPEHPAETASATPSPATPQPAPQQAAPAQPTSAPAPAVAAPAPVAAPPPPAAVPAPKWKDGTYTGWGTSRHGDIQAAVTIENGRIISATIAQCLTRYSCNVIGRLPPEVPERQSAEVDYVSGATQSTNAFYYAVTEALGKAK